MVCLECLEDKITDAFYPVFVKKGRGRCKPCINSKQLHKKWTSDKNVRELLKKDKASKIYYNPVELVKG